MFVVDVLKDVFRLYRQYKSPVTVCNYLDSIYAIPRPADAPFLPPYHAVMVIMAILTKMGMIALSCVVAITGFSLTFYWLELVFYSTWGAILLFVLLSTILIAFSEAKQLLFIYQRTQQRVSQGTAMMMEREMMEDYDILYPVGSNQESGTLPLGRYGKDEIGLPWEFSSCHTILLGPTGSGKSKTFFMNMLKRWAKKDSAIVIDPKGELMWQTGRNFKRVYRFNLIDPLNSDHWNFIPDCADPNVASDVASIILRVEPTKRNQGGNEKFWEDAEQVCLRALLMFLSTCRDEHGGPMTPADIQRLISVPEDFATPEQIRQAEEMLANRQGMGGTIKVTLLNLLMQSVPGDIGQAIREAWGMFTIIKQEGHANVLIGIGVTVGGFSIPTARELAQPIGRKRNSRWISFQELRKPGTVLYLIVQEGDTGMYQTVLTTFLGMAIQALRRSTDKDGTAKVLCLFDEAGNVPIWGLKEMLGLGRGRGIPMVLCYQDVNQIAAQYGDNEAKSIVGLATNFVFLPGLKTETAELASELLGKSTVWSHTAVDMVGGKGGDNERSSEIGRELMMTSEIRQLVRHRQAIAVIGSLPPVKMAYPPYAFKEDLPRYVVKTDGDWYEVEVSGSREVEESNSLDVMKHLGDTLPDEVVYVAEEDASPRSDRPDFLGAIRRPVTIDVTATPNKSPRLVKATPTLAEKNVSEPAKNSVTPTTNSETLTPVAPADKGATDDVFDIFDVIDKIEEGLQTEII